ncbi:MAG: formimidoylglutamate deiminase [Candidatus Eremiobacteraeota bacterium]|nr:formimidoylglutamate deiminase [Candidatus Eremiobacteraeota bacterium]
MSAYFAAHALLPGGWARDVLIETNAGGDIERLAEGAKADGAVRLWGPVLPGMPNVHSHAFQRALAGTAESGDPARHDTFWTWRDRMYRLVLTLEPPDIEAVATWVYLEMLKSGYTAVGEFHYLFHTPDGSRYDSPTETADRVIAAAERSGIGLTLLPALYTYSGFGQQAPSSPQRRFAMDVEEFCALWDALDARIGRNPQCTLGVAPHSLRAVSPQSLASVVTHVSRRRPEVPVHIHVAEQQAEVDACVAWCGARPVAWLLEHAPVSERWCLVHATHLDASERTRAALTGAVAGLCPTTEANLGDGIFPAQQWLAGQGRIGIGSDSQVTIDPAEELRWLEYGQRLFLQQRAVLCTAETPSVGGTLYRVALAGGAQALGRSIGRIERGFRADLVVLDGENSAFRDVTGDGLLDRYIFGGVREPVRDVMVGGRWVVANRRANGEHAAKSRYLRAVAHLRERA